MEDKEIVKLGILETLELIKSQTITSEYLTRLYLSQIEKYNYKNALLEVFDDAITRAKEIDEKIKSGQKVGKLAGLCFVIKDNMLYKGKKATCASKFLENFVSPYTATAVQKLLDEDAVIIGRANMDEFAMGGSNENSAYGNCKNAFSDEHVSGGSSGGSAVAVACNMCVASLGSDTGGSVRQPSSFNGVCGVKPTYGRISRFGIVAFASSLEQVGPITKNVKDNAYLLEILAGFDIHDQTTRREEVPNYLDSMSNGVKGMKLCYCKQLIEKYKDSKYYSKFYDVINFFVENGATVDEIDIKNIELALPTYYIIATAEATSNLGRFDGVKYTTRTCSSSDIKKLYVESRTAGFGDEVKRRIMLGNYVLSSGYFDAYYNKAKKVQQYISNSLNKVFDDYDAMIMPVAYGEAFKIGEKSKDPVSMYLEDMFTVIANIAGVPAMSVPYGFGVNNLPLGLQILTKNLCESKMYTIANFVEENYKGGMHD
ncbi:MAG: Asp-tRNA(Asn)/Glu-tRNA(Gln) amidotransferase subunit GatA [Clostridia bacterium]|nr:Asp-tRNA(Asn)/Glu-tRNA(Gln) amidotransferase subunit GatA [Clostridia bacterium]